MAIFLFNDVSELKRFSYFRVQPSDTRMSKWEVQAEGLALHEVIAKEFHSEKYANLFAEMCQSVAKKEVDL